MLLSAIFLFFAVTVNGIIADSSDESRSLFKRDETSVWPAQTFKTVDFRPPVFVVEKNGQALEKGLIFLTPLNTDPLATALGGIEGSASIIVTDDGQLVWQGPYNLHSNILSNAVSTFTFDFNAQELDGEPVLTHWIGPILAEGQGAYGKVVVYNKNYEEIYTVCPDLDIVWNKALITTDPGPCYIDLHEHFITPSGTMIISAYNITEFDFSAIGGPANGYIYDSQFHVVDIKTNEVLFSWSSIKSGIPITYTKLDINSNVAGNGTFESPFDWFHINAISSIGNGYLVNSRHCWLTLFLDEAGHIKWQIEGNNTQGQSNFTLPEEAFFVSDTLV
jgi:hypothetical protein